MTARTVRKVSFWIGVVAAAAVLLLPLIHQWLHPRKPVEAPSNAVGAIVFIVDVLGAMSEGFFIFMWIMGFAGTACVASLVAYIAAWRGRESRRVRMLCGLPVVLAAAMYGALELLDM